jgi:hypothetical protein
MSYSDKVIDHYNNPRNVGSMDKSSADVGTGLVGAPECGDVMKLQRDQRYRRSQVQNVRLRFRDRFIFPRHRVGQGQDGGRSPRHQEHGHREGALASSGEDPLFRVGRGRHPRRHRRLEEKAGEREAGCYHGSAVSVSRAFARGTGRARLQLLSLP